MPTIRIRRPAKKITAKMLAAKAALNRLRGQVGIQLAVTRDSVPGVVVKLDRMQGYCRSNPTTALQGIPGLKSGRSHRIERPSDGRFQAYGRVHWFENRTSGMKLLLESVFEVLPDFRMTLVELAFDFAPAEMNRKFVREHALFGKSRPVPSVNETDYWGTRRGSKRVQAYSKEIERVSSRAGDAVEIS
jgi:hypothetical protein